MRNSPSKWFIAFVSALGAGVVPAAGAADTGGVPIDPPACISILPALMTSCARAAPPPEQQTANPASAQST